MDKDGKQVYAAMKVQDPFSGEVKEVPVPKVEDLHPRTHIIRVTAGQEVIQKDFCKDCLEKIRPELQALWDKLEGIKDK